MAGMTEMVAEFRERQESVIAAAVEIKAARDEVRGAAADVRRAAEEFDTREFKLRQSYETAGHGHQQPRRNSFSQWAFLKMGVLAGGVWRGRGGVIFSFHRPRPA